MYPYAFSSPEDFNTLKVFKMNFFVFLLSLSLNKKNCKKEGSKFLIEAEINIKCI